MVMKKGLLALMLLAIVAAIPACRQRDCLDNDKKCESKCNPCNWFKCKSKCEKPEKKEKKKKKKCCPSFCDMFRCKKKCNDRDEEMREDMREDREMMRRDAGMAPRPLK
jgi:hypothetical protein